MHHVSGTPSATGRVHRFARAPDAASDANQGSWGWGTWSQRMPGQEKNVLEAAPKKKRYVE